MFIDIRRQLAQEPDGMLYPRLMLPSYQSADCQNLAHAPGLLARHGFSAQQGHKIRNPNMGEHTPLSWNEPSVQSHIPSGVGASRVGATFRSPHGNRAAWLPLGLLKVAPTPLAPTPLAPTPEAIGEARSFEGIPQKSSPGFLHLLTYTLGAGTIITLYLIAPAMSAWSNILPARWEQLVATFGTMGLAELGIYVILRKTTSRKQPQPSRLDYLRTLYQQRSPYALGGVAYGLR